jgi:phosphatidate cytidylyltransferase
MSLQKRAPTAIVLLALLFGVVQWAPPFVFVLVIQAVVVLALVEFYNLARRRGLRPQRTAGIIAALILAAPFVVRTVPLALAMFAALAFLGVYYLAYARTLERIAAVPASIAVTAFGALYIGFTLNFLVFIRAERGPFYLYFFFTAIFLGDTGAYLVGKLIGRHKMSPLVSPNKTWEGCAGGLVFAGLGAAVARQVLLPAVPLGTAVLCGLAVHAVAQASDPLESLFKRAAGVKDSSNLLPGHGGFLDRVDSLLLAAPVFYFWLLYLWK